MKEPGKITEMIYDYRTKQSIVNERHEQGFVPPADWRELSEVSVDLLNAFAEIYLHVQPFYEEYWEYVHNSWDQGASALSFNLWLAQRMVNDYL